MSSSGLRVLVLFGLSCASAAVIAQQAPVDQRPIFRAGTDLAQVSVRVLDNQRRPIKGLTEKDFSIVVNGVPQPIVAVAPEDLAGPVAPPAPWMRDIAPDVASNSITNPRLIVIILDDALFSMGNSAIGERKVTASPGGDLFTLKQTKLIGHAIVDQLGPTDLATVVFSLDNRAPQDFTSDRARLLAAIDSFHEGPNIEPYIAHRYSAGTLTAAIAYLREVPERASAVMWVSIGTRMEMDDLAPKLTTIDSTISEHVMATAIDDGISTLVGQSHVSGVPVYPISPLGLQAPVPSYISQHRSGAEMLRTIAAATGGHAIVDTNAPRDGVPGIFVENSYRYIVGYRPTFSMADGKYKHIKISVNRRDVIVEPSDRMMLSPTPEAAAASASVPTSATTPALSGIIPVTDEPLRLALAAFAVRTAPASGGPVATVTMALGVSVQSPRGAMLAGEVLDIETRIFDAEGRKQISVTHQTARLASRASPSYGGYELLSTLTLPKAGRYNVRVSTSSAARERTGGVYTDVTVPDFEKSPLSMSGVAISVRQERITILPGTDAAVIPITPTPRRDFEATERVTAFLRVYWGGDKAAMPAIVRTQIVNTQNAPVFERADTMAPTSITGLRSADYRLDVPLERLVPGEYLLTIRTMPPRGGEIRRDVRFTVR